MKGFDLLSRVYVEIGQSSLKMLDGEDGLELSLDRQENGRLTAPCRERLISGLRVFLKNNSWRLRRRAFCAVAARGVSLRRVTLPPCSKDAVERLLLLQIEREFPLAPDELAWGYQEVGKKHPSGNGAPSARELLVVAVKREVLQEYADILSTCGLTPVFTLAALARTALCSAAPAAFALLDVGRAQSELISFQDGAPASIRILPWGGDNITRALEKSLDLNHAAAEALKLQFDQPERSNVEPREKIEAALESELSTLATSIQPGWIGQKLFLTGSSARMTNIAPRLSSAIRGRSECEPITLSSRDGHSAAILGLKKALENENHAEPLVIRLSTGKETEFRTTPMQWKWPIVAAILLIGLFSMRYAEAFIQKRRLSRAIAEARSYREKLPAIDRELGFLQYLKTNQPAYLNPIAVMANAAAAGTRIESLSINRRGDFSLRAGMRDGQQVVEFRTKLIDSGLFDTVSVEEQTPTPDRQKIIVRIVGQWNPAAELKASALTPASGPREGISPEAPRARSRRQTAVVTPEPRLDGTTPKLSQASEANASVSATLAPTASRD